MNERRSGLERREDPPVAPKWHKIIRENWYRDVWLLIISIVLTVSAFKTNSNVEAIQASRIEITRDVCNDQNKRHDQTIARLDTLISEIPNPSRRKRAQENVVNTKSLIEALVPHQDCEALIEERYPKL